MKKIWIIFPAIVIISMSISACNTKETAEETVSSTEYPSVVIPFSEPASQTTESSTQDDTQDDADSGAPEAFVGTWRLDSEKTDQHLEHYASLMEMFGSGLGSYGAATEIGEDGSFSYFIGIGVGGTGQWEEDSEGIRVAITPYQDTGDSVKELHLKTVIDQDTVYLVMGYGEEELYWVLETVQAP